MSEAHWAELARLLVRRSLDVQPGWQVAVRSTPLGRPLVEECCREIARCGAYALPQIILGFERWTIPLAWAEEAPEELLGTLAPIERHAAETVDARLSILAPERVWTEPPLTAERRRLVQQALEPVARRSRAMEVRWVVTMFPTPAAAENAGMSVEELTEFLRDACLRDWDAERDRMSRVAERLEAASEVRIVGAGTDVTLGVGDRPVEVDHSLRNMPGGEVFVCPLEDTAEGVIEFSGVPGAPCRRPRRGHAARLPRRRGRRGDGPFGEELLHQALATDDGAKRLGELGIGCNEGITKPMGLGAVRREDRGHDPPRARRQLHVPRRHEREPHPLGRRQGPAQRRRAPLRRRGRAARRNLADLT